MESLVRFRLLHAVELAAAALLALGGFCAAPWLYSEFQFTQEHAEAVAAISIELALGSLILFYLFGLYGEGRGTGARRAAVNAGLAVAALLPLMLAVSALQSSSRLPASLLLFGWLLQFVFVISFRLLVHRIRVLLEGGKKALILSGSPAAAERLMRKMEACKGSWFAEIRWAPVPEPGGLAAALEEVDTVVLPAKERGKEAIAEVCCMLGKELLIVPDVADLGIVDAVPEHFDDVLMLSVRPRRFGPIRSAVKRLFDIAASALLLTAAMPVMLLLYWLIPLISPGAAIYIQERVGLNGKVFRIYKFRTMVDNAEQLTGPTLAAGKDPRITRFGAFLRASRLDELPQLFNVLKGDMSLVGPRPERPVFVEQFARAIPTYHRRAAVRPGITGLAQVMGKYSTLPQEKHRFDLMYIQNRSLLLDLKILLRTLAVMLHKEQAGGVDREQDKPETLSELKGRAAEPAAAADAGFSAEPVFPASGDEKAKIG